MGSAFNPQILVEKLAKLNNSQQSIETLSHWCIFHMNKAKQVVETWARQFHSSPRDQRLAFLYLANDILQNSRRKGSEFVGEFWKVLPDALRDVIDNGDEFGRNSALRLVTILDERKVFGSRGQVLKEELVRRHMETSNRNGKHSGLQLKQPAGNAALDKIVSGYQVIYGGQVNEDAVINKCKDAIGFVEKAENKMGGDIRSVNGAGVTEELKGQHATLRDCIEQLTVIESSRTSLVSYLREALQEQEMKLERVRSQLQAAHIQAEKADNICRQLHNPNGIQSPPVPVTGEQSAPVMYKRQPPLTNQSEEDTKSAAAAVAAKLTASTSSAEMLTYVLSSLASEGIIGNSSSNDYPLQKRTKITSDQSQNGQPPVPTVSYVDQQPPPPSSPPPPPPMPPMQPYPAPAFMVPAGTVAYGHLNQPPPPLMAMAGFPGAGPPVNGVSSYIPADGYQNYQMEGGFYSQQPAMSMAPMSRQ
ncbi:hypothetical protein L2E82_33204 [Cichorium intybus]|uniref:Uncharacterized protein n=1 Tax=Cichorium intybus TaxID=13427 RepID=A0ACB9BJI6_CICIN|nr:hypothetical protein L2E82_33204 [Cichorium intybus]